jgi:hypothetical protein
MKILGREAEEAQDALESAVEKHAALEAKMKKSKDDKTSNDEEVKTEI